MAGRYRDIAAENIRPGMVLRIVDSHRETKSQITFEGTVKEVIKEWQPAIIQTETFRGQHVVVAVDFTNGQMAAIRGKDGWTLTKLERALPELPTTIGSVIKSGRRAAIYRQSTYSGVVPVEYEWFWTDELDLDVKLKESDLDAAVVLFVADA